MNSRLLRAATWEMASAEAELISPISSAAPSRSSILCALVVAVSGLIESSDVTSSWRPMTPPAALISSAAMRMPMDRPFAERAQEPRHRGQVADADLVRLRGDDIGKSERRSGREPRSDLESRAPIDEACPTARRMPVLRHDMSSHSYACSFCFGGRASSRRISADMPSSVGMRDLKRKY